jgi:hypothetical protein
MSVEELTDRYYKIHTQVDNKYTKYIYLSPVIIALVLIVTKVKILQSKDAKLSKVRSMVLILIAIAISYFLFKKVN